MVTEVLTVINELGIHARPSGAISRTANKYQSSILIIDEAKKEIANAKIMLEVMILASEQYTKLQVKVEGPDEKEAFEAIRHLFDTGFGEAYK